MIALLNCPITTWQVNKSEIKLFEKPTTVKGIAILINTDTVDNVEGAPWLANRTTNIYSSPPRNSHGIRDSINIHH